MTKKEAKKLLEYISGAWDKLICGSQNGVKTGKNPEDVLYLPYDYIVPNKEKFNVMFYWDSYFIIQGLKTEKRYELIKNIVDNCLYEVKNYGRVLNANKRKWATRSQLPYLSLMIQEVYNIREDKKWLETAFNLAKKEYNDYWLDKFHLTPAGLSRFYDESGTDKFYSRAYKSRAESSWDMSPRYDDKDVHNLAPVDLNCNLYRYEKDFSDFSRILVKKEEEKKWRSRAISRKKLINKLMWDEKDGLFYDYNFAVKEKKKIKSLASYQTMFVKLAGRKQAEKMKKNLKLFETKSGLAACDRDYGHKDRQWNWPIVWAPLQLICHRGLKNYVYEKEAEKIGKNFVKLVFENWQKTGKIWEKYNGLTCGTEAPFDRYKNQSGFGWTNAVAEVFIKEIYKI